MKVRCPRCPAMVSMRHDGSQDMLVESPSSGWVFNTHLFDDLRGGDLFRVECPASDHNMYTAKP